MPRLSQPPGLARAGLRGCHRPTSHRPARVRPICTTAGPVFLFCLRHRSPRPARPQRHPATGLVHRINVCYLDNGYWVCYREEEP